MIESLFQTLRTSVDLTSVVLIWLMCAIGAGLVAGEKKRSFGAWLLLGVLLGPFALIWAIKAPKVIPPAEARACPHCGKSMHVVDDICPHCRQRTTPAKPDVASRVGREAAGAVFIMRHALRRRGKAPPSSDQSTKS